jgi:hypothetical protein
MIKMNIKKKKASRIIGGLKYAMTPSVNPENKSQETKENLDSVILFLNELVLILFFDRILPLVFRAL